MKKVTTLLLAIFLLVISAAAQSADEKELMSIHKALEKAYQNREIGPFETTASDDFVGAYPDGKATSKAEALDEARKEIAKPSYIDVSETSDDIKVRAIGNVGYVTASWESISKAVDTANAAPHTDTGRYLGVYEKRAGKWMLVAESYTEAGHDRKLMEQQVIATSKLYDAAMKSRDKAAYELLLNKDYMYTNEDGKLLSRADDIAHFAAGNLVIETAETTDQKVRITSNSTAVETGMYHVTGTNKGKAFEETGRYTTTWVWSNLRWQIIADHTSIVKK